MRLFSAFFIILFCILNIGLADAENSIILHSTDSNSEQTQINKALQDYLHVHLESGTYKISDSIIINSNNILTADSDAIILIPSSSSQWFKGLKGLITNNEPVDNIRIDGIKIDGNCDELPKSYSDDTGVHDCQRAIVIKGSKNRFCKNITICNVETANCFSDGIHVRFAEYVYLANNFVSNCQHSGLYYVCVRNATMSNNKVAGITSDCARLDNCEFIKVQYNYFYSYTGDLNNGAAKNGQNGLQISDQGYSHNGGSDKSDIIHTNNIEVTNNMFVDCGRTSIWLDSAKKGLGENVYIDNNEYKDVPEVVRNGSPISIDNQPTVEMSKKVFKSIFDVNALELTETGKVKQGSINVINPEWVIKGKTEAYIYLAGYEGQINIKNETYIPTKPSKCAKVIFDTKNLASRPDGQETELELIDLKNGSLKTKLKVETYYKVKYYKTESILGYSFKVADYKEKSETSTFTKIFNAPKVFPVFNESDLDVNVTFYNNSYNPHATVLVVSKGNSDTISSVKFKYKDSEAVEYRLMGYVNTTENGFKITNFDDSITFKSSDSNISREYNGCYIKGNFDKKKLHVTVNTPFDTIKVTNFSYEEVKDPVGGRFHSEVFVIFLVLFAIIRPFIQDLQEVFRRLR